MYVRCDIHTHRELDGIDVALTGISSAFAPVVGYAGIGEGGNLVAIEVRHLKPGNAHRSREDMHEIREK